MQNLTVEFIDNSCDDANVDTVSLHMDKLRKHTLQFTPWSDYPYRPEVQFSIAYTSNRLLLKYFVREKFIRAAAGKTNGNVWEDSCVEFFVSLNGISYYNFEFSCIGTALVGFGKTRTDRKMLPEEVVNLLDCTSKIEKHSNAVYWELTIAIPFSTFIYDHPISLPGKRCKANFYKCGDALPQPHYISWSNIKAPEPDFHLLEFFGTLDFM